MSACLLRSLQEVNRDFSWCSDTRQYKKQAIKNVAFTPNEKSIEKL